MSSEELQEEEREVLNSIYDGDDNFKAVSETVFQYKYGEDGSYKSFVLEVSWPANYPEEFPVISMDAFYNKHIVQSVKDFVKEELHKQAEELLGMSMTFSLFEWVKDNLDTVLAEQPDTPVVQVVQTSSPTEDKISQAPAAPKEKKEVMSKSQKRRMFDRFGANTEKPRGWDWVDIIKHLSQTGGQRPDD